MTNNDDEELDEKPELAEKVGPKIGKTSWGGPRANSGGRRPGSGCKQGTSNKITRRPESETATVAACREILDRAYGKAMQPIQGTMEYGRQPAVERALPGGRRQYPRRGDCEACCECSSVIPVSVGMDSVCVTTLMRIDIRMLDVDSALALCTPTAAKIASSRVCSFRRCEISPDGLISNSVSLLPARSAFALGSAGETLVS